MARVIFAVYLCRRHARAPFRPWVPNCCANPDRPQCRCRVEEKTRLSKPATHGKPSDVQVPAVAVGLITAFE